jgi:hypothetical protein
MLRVLVFDEPFTLTLRIEGVLDTTSIAEFHRAVAVAKAKKGNRKFLADVGELKLQDAAAESALLEERNAGLRLFAASGRIAELLQQQERRECESRCSVLQRIAFVLTAFCKTSSRPFCLKLYRLLNAAQ